MAYNLGSIIRLTYAVKNDSGQAANPSTATVTITQPDGTTASPSVTLPPSVTGQLVVDFTPTQAGLHSVRWATATPTTAEDDVFIVEAAGRMLVSVDEAVNHLRASGVITSDADRETLQWLCMAATDAVERDLGRVLVRRTVTETHTGYGPAIILRQTPVLSITSVTESGTALTGTDYLLDSSTGILYRGTTTGLRSYVAGALNVTVVYVAGYTDPPRAARMVALNLIQSMWQQSQTAFHPGLDESAELPLQMAVAGLPDPLRRAYDSLRAAAVA
jgi:hypothetical protein